MSETNTKTLESTPSNAAVASSIGAANIDLRLEVQQAASKAATGLYASNMRAATLDRSKLIAKVCAIVKSKRGFAEKQLPPEIYEQICDEVANLIQSTFSNTLTKYAGLTYKSTPVFRKNHDTAPVAVRHTMSSVQEIHFKEQRLLLNIKLGDAERKLRAALNLGNPDRIAKWEKAVQSCETMLATLTEAELIASETAKA